LYAALGPQHWWPASSAFEVIVGAILTQNTAWTNVEKAIANLRAAGVLSVRGIRNISTEEIERMVRPSGYFRQKAKRLKDFVDWLDCRYRGSVQAMLATKTAELRNELLGLNGIGPETADSILLYAGQHEIFVVDAYTRRIFERHGLIRTDTAYDHVRVAVEKALLGVSASIGLIEPNPGNATPVEPGPGPTEELCTITVHPPSVMSEANRSEVARNYNEFHALIVQIGKHYCQSRVAKCDACPLQPFLKNRKPLLRKGLRRFKH
jgi:endonuclease-3 related protein